MRNKEQAILEAAEREFIAKGFAGARTTSIAEAAGVTHAMLHYYFRLCLSYCFSNCSAASTRNI